MKKQTHEQKIERELLEEEFLKKKAEIKPNRAKMRQKFNYYYNRKCNENLQKVKDFVGLKNNPAHTKRIIRGFSDKMGIKYVLTKEYWNTVGDTIQNNWDIFLEYYEKYKPETNLQRIKNEIHVRFGIGKQNSNIFKKYGRRFNIKKDINNEDGSTSKNPLYDNSYIADKIIEDGEQKFYDYIQKNMERKQRRREKARKANEDN